MDKSKMISYGGSLYYIDMQRLIEFIKGTPDDDCNSERVVSQSYGFPNTMSPTDITPSKIQLIAKETSETKNAINETMVNIRYDLIKNLTSLLLVGQGVDGETQGPDDFMFGQILAFNTLVSEKIIVEITTE